MKAIKAKIDAAKEAVKLYKDKYEENMGIDFTKDYAAWLSSYDEYIRRERVAKRMIRKLFKDLGFSFKKGHDCLDLPDYMDDAIEFIERQYEKAYKAFYTIDFWRAKYEVTE